MTILFAGGDERTRAASEYLRNRGFSVETYGLTHRIPRKTDPDLLILPFPCLKRGKLNAPLIKDPPTLAEFMDETGISPAVPAIGGPIPDNPFSDYTDLSCREDLKIRNAVTTAEGALDLLIQNTNRAVFGTDCLIVGYGAIGKRLSKILSALGANVTVAARKAKDRTEALFHGYGTQDALSPALEGFGVIFNTVPKILITEEVLKRSAPDAVFFELASSPGGIDRAAAERLRRRVVDGPALPGKVAPLTAGEDLAKTVVAILQEKGSGT